MAKAKVIGIQSDRMYYQSELIANHGLTDDTLSDARKSGIVKPFECGRRNLYDGAELVAFLRTLPRKEVTAQ